MPSAADTLMILSSMSVTLRTNVTSLPNAISQRRSTSNETPERMWPTCGAAWTVGPQTYIPTVPSTSGVNGRTWRARVSYRRRLTGASLRTARRRAGYDEGDRQRREPLAATGEAEPVGRRAGDRHRRAERTAHGALGLGAAGGDARP